MTSPDNPFSKYAETFERDGYVVIPGLLSPEGDLGPVLADFQRTLDGILEGLFAAGQISSVFRDLPFTERLLAVARETGRSFAEYFAPVLPVTDDVTEDTPILISEAIFNVLTNWHLLDCVESIIGGEISASPGQKTRVKLPEIHIRSEGYSTSAGTVPWHQDGGIIDAEADETAIVTAWIPLTPATHDNGCLMVVPGSHLGELHRHAYEGPIPVIPDGSLDTKGAVELPVEPGVAILIHRRTLHASLTNVTDDEVRLSLDLRFQPSNEPTGFGMLPSFVVRSRSNETSELRDFNVYKRDWHSARRQAATQRSMPRFREWAET